MEGQGLAYRLSISFLDINGPSMLHLQTHAATNRALYSGLVRIHILYHACQGPIFGFEMIEELGRHGYKLSPGTLYPLLHGLEKKGLLRSRETRSGGRLRRFYRATPPGRRALAVARGKVKELLGELLENELE